MKFSAILLVCFLGFASANQPEGLWNLTTTELVQHFGYPAEIHHVTTADGYILELHRVPHGINDTKLVGRPVVFLNHCLLCSSADFFWNTPDKGFGYLMADAGYDVWLGNFRGNTYSRRHTTLDPKDIKFWEFSWDEMALVDLPTMLDYVLESTEQENLKLVGFSMGTTTTLAMLSEMPQYNAKISKAALLAPVAWISHPAGLAKLIMPQMALIDIAATAAGVGDFFPSATAFKEFVDKYCDDGMHKTISEACVHVVSAIAGFDEAIINRDWLPIIMSHTPAGTSYHTLTHYAQMLYSGHFGRYDYGTQGNMQHYNATNPPSFDLSHVTIPIGLFWGQNDYLADPTDVAHLVSELPNLAISQRIAWDKFNHLDFMWSTKAPTLVYPDVMKFLGPPEKTLQ